MYKETCKKCGRVCTTPQELNTHECPPAAPQSDQHRIRLATDKELEVAFANNAIVNGDHYICNLIRAEQQRRRDAPRCICTKGEPHSPECTIAAPAQPSKCSKPDCEGIANHCGMCDAHYLAEVFGAKSAAPQSNQPYPFDIPQAQWDERRIKFAYAQQQATADKIQSKQPAQGERKLEVAGHAWEGTCFSQSGRYGNCQCGKFLYCDYSQHQKHLASLAAPAVQPSPPSADAKKLAEKVIQSWLSGPSFGQIGPCADLLESFRAETLEQAAQHIRSRAEAHRKSIQADKGERFNKGMADICEALDMIAEQVRTLHSDPYWLARQIAGGLEQAAQIADRYAAGRKRKSDERMASVIASEIRALSATKLESGK